MEGILDTITEEYMDLLFERLLKGIEKFEDLKPRITSLAAGHIREHFAVRVESFGLCATRSGFNGRYREKYRQLQDRLYGGIAA